MSGPAASWQAAASIGGSEALSTISSDRPRPATVCRRSAGSTLPYSSSVRGLCVQIQIVSTIGSAGAPSGAETAPVVSGLVEDMGLNTAILTEPLSFRPLGSPAWPGLYPLQNRGGFRG